jgi:hypothetical protein
MRLGIILALGLIGCAISTRAAFTQESGALDLFKSELDEARASREISAAMCSPEDAFCVFQNRRLAIMLSCAQVYRNSRESRLECFDRRARQFLMTGQKPGE